MSRIKRLRNAIARRLAGIPTIDSQGHPAEGRDVLMAWEVAEHLPPDIEKRYWEQCLDRYFDAKQRQPKTNWIAPRTGGYSPKSSGPPDPVPPPGGGR